MEAGPSYNLLTPSTPLARAVTEFREPFGGPLRLLEVEPRHARWDALAVLVAPIGLLYFFPFLQWLLRGTAAELQIDETDIAFGKVFEMLLAIGVAAYFVRRNGVQLRSFGIQFAGFGRQLLWSIAAFASAYAYLIATAILISPLLYYFYGSQAIEHGMPEKQRMFENIGGISMPWLLLTLAAVAIHEELLFRGLLLTFVRRASGSWWIAIVGSSAVFGSLHFNQGWLAMLQVTGLGIVLSVLFVASRSLIAVIIAHFLFNFCQVQIMQVLLPWLKQFEQIQS